MDRPFPDKMTFLVRSAFHMAVYSITIFLAAASSTDCRNKSCRRSSARAVPDALYSEISPSFGPQVGDVAILTKSSSCSLVIGLYTPPPNSPFFFTRGSTVVFSSFHFPPPLQLPRSSCPGKLSYHNCFYLSGPSPVKELLKPFFSFPLGSRFSIEDIHPIRVLLSSVQPDCVFFFKGRLSPIPLLASADGRWNELIALAKPHFSFQPRTHEENFKLAFLSPLSQIAFFIFLWAHGPYRSVFSNLYSFFSLSVSGKLNCRALSSP